MKSDRILEGMHNEVVTDRLDRLHYSAAKEVRRSRDQRELARYVREEKVEGEGERENYGKDVVKKVLSIKITQHASSEYIVP